MESILDLSALEAGRFPLHLLPTPLSDVVRTVVARFSLEAGRENIRVSIPTACPPVLADERALDSVLYHLLDNALKYAPGQEVLVEAWFEGESVHVGISDAGPGIPVAERERVFEMFHRLDGSDSREVYGHGLGLHLAKQFLEAMGGGVHAGESDQGGARIEFWLPAAREEVPG